MYILEQWNGSALNAMKTIVVRTAVIKSHRVKMKNNCIVTYGV